MAATGRLICLPNAKSMASLLEWHKRLSAHFEAIAAHRAADKKRGVFALEHGLDGSEIADLQAVVRQAAKNRTADAKSALPWIVYATELGYRYSGNEYWQTFEEETPGWAENWERGWLRDQFHWFTKKFHGVQPVGAWAQHFSIICWPIANAVLPRDLQLQLARILYEMAYKLNSQLLHNPEQLGTVIATRSWGTSPRFQNLAEESLFIGQIATALLLEGEDISRSLILPATLRRIAADLDREQQSKEWLKRARGIALERLKAKGLATGGEGGQSAALAQSDELRTIALEPRFVLRPSLRKSNAWTVFLEIPNLTAIIELIPDSQQTLLNSRCVVAGTDGRPIARGRVLQGLQRISILKWPTSGEPLLSFERKSAQLDLVLRTHFSMSGGPRWLFRVASDGLGYELKGAGLRAGQTYVVLARTGTGSKPPDAIPVEIECDGVDALLLHVPDTLERQQIDDLKSAGLSVAKSIRVWPVGTEAVSWDGEGRGEWLATEQPCFAIKSDHALKSFEATIGGQQIQLGAVSAGEAFFVAFPLLAPGRHEITLLAKEGAFVPATSLGKLEIFSRPPRAWQPGKGAHGPLLLDIDPINPTLEQLREGGVDMFVRGPVGRELGCRARLFQRGKDLPAFDRQLPKLTLPLVPEAWNRHLQRHLFGVREVEELYDSTSLCDIQFQADELGMLSLRFERESVPVRWAVRSKGKSRQITLVSDVAQEQPVQVSMRTFERPDFEEQKDAGQFRGWYDAPSSGGFFLARVGGFSSGVILPPEVHDFRDLGLNTCVANRARSPQMALSTLQLINLWSSARLSGNLLSGDRQRRVIRMLTGHLHFVIAGERWEAIELAPTECPASELMHVFAGRPEELAIAKSVLDQSDALASLPAAKRVEWLYEKCQKPLGISRVWRVARLRDGSETPTLLGQGTPTDPMWLCEFALRIASEPGQAIRWGGDQLQVGVAKLCDRPVLSRLARFLVIALDKNAANGSSHSGATLYAGWDWR